MDPQNEMDENTNPVIPELLISADLGLWPATICRSEMDSLVLRGPLGDPDIVFPSEKNGRRKKHGCKLYDRNPLSSLAQDGCCDWNHMGDVLKTHEKSKNHFDAYRLWLETELRLTNDNGIDQINQQLLKKEVQRWRDVLERLLAITLYLAEHNLAFRGSSDKLFTPHNGNFLGLVQLLGQFDETLKEHLKRVLRKQIIIVASRFRMSLLVY